MATRRRRGIRETANAGRPVRPVAMTVNERLLDRAIRHAHFLERLKTGEANRILALLNTDLYPKVLSAVARLESINTEDWGGRMRQSPRLTKARRRIAKMIDDGIEKAAEKLNISLDRLANVEANWAIQAINQEMPVVVNMKLPSPNQLAAIRRSQPFRGKLLKDWYRSLSASTKTQVSNAINTGIADGSSIPDIVRSLKGTRAAGFGDGILAQSRREVTTVVRTAVTHVTARAREMVYEQNDDVVKGVQWVSTLDQRTTEVCLEGSTLVEPVGGLHKLYRRRYRGDVLVVRTSSGKELVGTPNHPVLTAHGWLPLDELEPGKHILYSVPLDEVDRVGVEHVGVPTQIGSLFDAASNPPASGVLLERSSAADLDKDGVGGDSEVDVLTLHRPLRLRDDPGVLQHGEDDEFRGVHRACAGASLRHRETALVADGFMEVAAEFQSRSFQCGVDRALGLPDGACDVDGLTTSEEQFDDLRGTLSLSAPDVWHDARLLEQTRHCGGRRMELPTYRGGADTLSVEPDDVVSVRRELRSTHVYNLGTETGVYIANGLIVHNCGDLDGRVFPTGEGQRPPAHFNCRSTTTPVLRSFREMGIAIDEPPAGSRAARDLKTGVTGKVPATTTYVEWLKRQSPADVRKILGKAKADAFLSGKISFDKFVKNGRPLTVGQLRDLELI